MANWLLVVDPDTEQRSTYVRKLRSVIAPLDNLSVSCRDAAGWSVIWAAGDRAPCGEYSDSQQDGTFVWGEARDSHGHVQSAEDIRRHWSSDAARQWDGYYSALTVENGGQTVFAGSDVLGVYPVYYWFGSSGVLLVGTSPELFRSHGAFSASLSVEGLIGILLTNGLVDNQTILSGVRRLAAGNRLCFADSRVFEDQAYRIPTVPIAVDVPTSGHVHELDRAFSAAVRRHAPSDRSHSFLLSGGLDSRLLAGYLADYGQQIECLTFGESRDYEMRCAKKVARACGMRHRGHRVPVDKYTEAVRNSAQWEMLSAGFSGIYEWTIHDCLDALPGRVIGGHLLDAVIGGSHIDWAYDAESNKLGFRGLRKTVHSWGFEPHVLKSMLIPKERGAVDAVMETLQKEYESSARHEHYRSWIFDLHHRQRFHVGAVLWPISFSAWPVIPCLDRNVIETVAGFPCSSLAQRRVQDELFVSRFPGLAMLPIDRNSEDCLPTNPRLRDFLARSLAYRVEKLGRLVRGALGIVERERIFYRRLYDINSPEWRDVRRLDEPSGYSLPDMFLKEEVRKYLPGPETSIKVRPPVIPGTSAARLLLGLSLCNRAFTN